MSETVQRWPGTIWMPWSPGWTTTTWSPVLIARTRRAAPCHRVFFPADQDLPFLMTHFSIDPRPSDTTHPGGVRRIASVRLPVPEDKRRLVRSLCEDDALVLTPPGTTMRVTFDDGTSPES